MCRYLGKPTTAGPGDGLNQEDVLHKITPQETMPHPDTGGLITCNARHGNSMQLLSVTHEWPDCGAFVMLPVKGPFLGADDIAWL